MRIASKPRMAAMPPPKSSEARKGSTSDLRDRRPHPIRGVPDRRVRLREGVLVEQPVEEDVKSEHVLFAEARELRVDEDHPASDYDQSEQEVRSAPYGHARRGERR